MRRWLRALFVPLGPVGPLTDDESPLRDTRREREAAAYFEAHRDDPDEWGVPVASTGLRRRLASMFSVRLAPAELDEIRGAAEEEGVSVSAFLRSAALERVRRLRDCRGVVLSDAQVAEWEARWEAAVRTGMPAVTVLPSDLSLVAAFLERVKCDYQPWARRHVHTLLDELIGRVKEKS